MYEYRLKFLLYLWYLNVSHCLQFPFLCISQTLPSKLHCMLAKSTVILLLFLCSLQAYFLQSTEITVAKTSTDFSNWNSEIVHCPLSLIPILSQKILLSFLKIYSSFILSFPACLFTILTFLQGFFCMFFLLSFLPFIVKTYRILSFPFLFLYFLCGIMYLQTEVQVSSCS